MAVAINCVFWLYFLGAAFFLLTGRGDKTCSVHSCRPPGSLLRGGRGWDGGWGCLERVGGLSKFPSFWKNFLAQIFRLGQLKTDAGKKENTIKGYFHIDELLFYWLLKVTVFSSLCPDVCVSSPPAVRQLIVHQRRQVIIDQSKKVQLPLLCAVAATCTVAFIQQNKKFPSRGNSNSNYLYLCEAVVNGRSSVSLFYDIVVLKFGK